VGALGAAREEHVEAQLGDIVELALGGGVVDRHGRVLDEAEEGVAVIPVVAHGQREGLGRQERRLDGDEPLLEVGDDRLDVPLPLGDSLVELGDLVGELRVLTSSY
jgi:hypothetical protein